MFTNQSKRRPKHSLQLEIRCRKDTVDPESGDICHGVPRDTHEYYV